MSKQPFDDQYRNFFYEALHNWKFQCGHPNPLVSGVVGPENALPSYGVWLESTANKVITFHSFFLYRRNFL